METFKNAHVLKNTLPLQGATVLDLGCGAGQMTRYLKRHAGFVIGLEPGAQQLEKALKTQEKEPVAFVQSFGQSLPFKNQSFDIVVLFNSLHHIPTQLHADCFIEIARILKSRGLVYVSEPLARGPNFELLKPIEDETRVRAEAYESLLKAKDRGFHMKQEKTYIHPVLRRSYEETRSALIGANPARKPLFDQMDAMMRQNFETLGQIQEDGTFLFEQPTRMNLLQKL